MAQKQSKNTKAKISAKPAKNAPAKKGKPLKTVKELKNKSVKPSGKTAKPAPKTDKNKPAKKVVKAAAPVKNIKSVKNTASPKKAVKSGKAAAKPVVAKASPKGSKSEKESKKTITLVLPAKKGIDKPKKAIKEDKTAKKDKLKAKEEKPVKKIKAEKISFDDEPKASSKPAKKSKGGRKPKKQHDDEDEPVIENDLLIEQLINSTKKLKKPVKVPKQLRTFTNPMASLAVAPVDGNKKAAIPKKEPKGKFELEYVMRTSAGILYEFLTSPSGLAEWFADDVNIHDGIFTFFWEGSEQKARLIGFKDEKYVRLQWLDKPDGTFFEFRIEKDDLTGDISLIVTDFADEAADLQTSKLLWDSQVNQLLHVIGSYS
ncbi:MAG: START-like domain-containing protein [Bacteroidota bacterium]